MAKPDTSPASVESAFKRQNKARTDAVKKSLEKKAGSTLGPTELLGEVGKKKAGERDAQNRLIMETVEIKVAKPKGSGTSS